MNLFQKTSLTNDIKVEENTKLSESDVNVSNFFVNFYEISQVYAHPKRLEGVEAFERKVSDLLSDINKSIVQNIITFSDEVDRGNLTLIKDRSSIKKLSEDYFDFSKLNSLPHPLLIDFISSIEAKKKTLKESINSFESKLQNSNFSNNPKIIIQTIEEEFSTIQRCCTKLSKLNYKTSEFRSKIQILQSKPIQDHLDEKNSLVSNVMKDFENYLEERKRLIEKRDKITDFNELCKPSTTLKGGILGRGTGLGLNAGSSILKSNTSTQSTTQPGQSLLNTPKLNK